MTISDVRGWCSFLQETSGVMPPKGPARQPRTVAARPAGALSFAARAASAAPLGRFLPRLAGASAPALFLGVAMLAGPAMAQDAPPYDAPEGDEIRITYPDRSENGAEAFIVLGYSNAASKSSTGGRQTIDTRFGPITFEIKITMGPETLVLHDWPADMWPVPPEITVEDGEEGFIAFLPAMM